MEGPSKKNMFLAWEIQVFKVWKSLTLASRHTWLPEKCWLCRLDVFPCVGLWLLHVKASNSFQSSKTLWTNNTIPNFNTLRTPPPNLLRIVCSFTKRPLQPLRCQTKIQSSKLFVAHHRALSDLEFFEFWASSIGRFALLTQRLWLAKPWFSRKTWRHRVRHPLLSCNGCIVNMQQMRKQWSFCMSSMKQLQITAVQSFINVSPFVSKQHLKLIWDRHAMVDIDAVLLLGLRKKQ